MSTRCVITVIEGEGATEERYSIYRHSDGYPESKHGVLADLELALPMAWPLPRFEACDFAAAIVATMKTGGGGIYLTTSAAAHGDIEYHYEIRQHPTEHAFLIVTVNLPVHDNGYEIVDWKPVKGANYLPAAGPLSKLLLDKKPRRVRS